MLVKDIIKETATLLGRDDLIEFVNTPEGQIPNTTHINDIEKLVRLINMVTKEFALTYVPMKCVEHKQAVNGKITYSSLTHTPYKITRVYGEDGNDLDFAVKTEYLEIKDGYANVEYEYMPPNYEYNGQVGYNENEIPVYVLALGVASEFCLSINWFSEAVMWHDRYINEAQKLYKTKNANIKQRSWV